MLHCVNVNGFASTSSLKWFLIKISSGYQDMQGPHQQGVDFGNSSVTLIFICFQLIHFEYNFRFLGEGGPLMTSFRDFRKALDSIFEFYDGLSDSRYFNGPGMVIG